RCGTERCPDEVTGVGATVAVRAPSHPAARAWLARVGVPLAAPSANRAEHVSPTSAAHVLRDLNGRIDAVLDGGRCPVGIESTVLALEGEPRLLRAGAISRAEIEELIGPVSDAPPMHRVARNGTPSATASPAPPAREKRGRRRNAARAGCVRLLQLPSSFSGAMVCASRCEASR